MSDRIAVVWRIRLEAQDTSLSRRRSGVRIPHALPTVSISWSDSVPSAEAPHGELLFLLGGVVGIVRCVKILRLSEIASIQS